MKEWIMELCPEIAEWQAVLIAEHAWKVACPSCGSNKVECAVCASVFTIAPQPQPKQEPVACRTLCDLCVKRDYVFCANAAKTTPIPTAPQPQQWLGLTDREKHNLVTDWFAEYWAIEKAMGLLDDYDAKLREKNS
jgi:hypothetical protein